MGRKGLEVHILASGSDGNCAVMQSEETNIMIDAGLSGSQIERKLSSVGVDASRLDAILLTHEHRDHSIGAGVLSRRYQVPIAANHETIVRAGIGPLQKPIIFETSLAFRLGDLTITPLPTSHDAAEPNAFLISGCERRCLLATDLGMVTDQILSSLTGCDLAILEANHDLKMLLKGPYPEFLKEAIRGKKGHLSNADCGAALKATHEPGRKVFLAHLSRENNRPDIACETVARAIGCDKDEVDCLTWHGDARSITVH
ncbi:MAG: MBL fold metallo-hydrolase [Methanomassiliicoccales archaeon]|nr:MBL fold metallo-hydrolase [Methanomassiliicoccales archaeon]